MHFLSLAGQGADLVCSCDELTQMREAAEAIVQADDFDDSGQWVGCNSMYFTKRKSTKTCWISNHPYDPKTSNPDKCFGNNPGYHFGPSCNGSSRCEDGSNCPPCSMAWRDGGAASDGGTLGGNRRADQPEGCDPDCVGVRMCMYPPVKILQRTFLD